MVLLNLENIMFINLTAQIEKNRISFFSGDILETLEINKE
jgi:hypothetical protein